MARPGLRIHPKFRRLVHLLNVPDPHAWGYLECLWEAAYAKESPDIGDAKTVQLVTQYPGQPEKIVHALVEAGFLDRLQDSTYAVHDLEDNAPDYVRARLRMRRYRAKKGHGGEPLRNGDERLHPPHTPPAQRSAAQRVRDESLTPSCSEPDKPASEPAVTDQPHVEHASPVSDVKPRSGRQRDRDAGTASDQAASLDSAGDPVVLSFPVVGGKGGKGSTEWPLRRSKLAEYQESFPHLDILAECRKALQWCRDNPGKRKTPRGMPAFLTRWLVRAQDSGRGRPRFGAAEDTETIEQRVERQRRQVQSLKPSGPTVPLSEVARRVQGQAVAKSPAKQEESDRDSDCPH